MKKGTTASGFEFEITDEREDDFEIVETLQAWLGGDNMAFWKFPRLLLGPEGEAALKEHCRDKETGKVSRKAMIACVQDLLNAQPVKN